MEMLALFTNSLQAGAAARKSGGEVVPAQGGYRVAPARSEVDEAANEAATSPQNELEVPTDAQREAGNYRMGHVRVGGLDITIEFPAGAVRTGVGPDGKAWAREVRNHYGYIKRTTGGDGEQVDVFLGPELDSPRAFVIDQVTQQNGVHDEHKVMLGFPNQIAAMSAYRANFKPGWKVGPVTAMTISELLDWLENGDMGAPARTYKR